MIPRGWTNRWGKKCACTATLLLTVAFPSQAEIFRRPRLIPVTPPTAPPPKAKETPEPLSFATIASKLEASTATNFKEALPLLPETLFDDYVLMRATESQQPATPSEPRAILFGGTGDLVMTYGALGNSLEAAEYDRKNFRWNFYEIRFDTGRAKASKANPSGCIKCHQEPMRPNWDPYSLWTGAYGERDGHLGNHRKEYFDFVDTIDAKSPYFRLKRLKTHYIGDEKAFDPNTRFTLNLTQRNMARVAKEISKSPAYDSIKWAAVAAAAGCGELAPKPILNFLPKDSEIRRYAEAHLATKLLAAPTNGDASAPEELVVMEAVLEAAGVPFDRENAALPFELREQQKRAQAQKVSLDPFSHGLGGVELFPDWGFAAVDKDIEKVIAPSRTPYEANLAPAQTDAQRLTRPFVERPFAGGAAIRKLCATFEALSLEALKGFTPPLRRGTTTLGPSKAPPSKPTHDAIKR